LLLLSLSHTIFVGRMSESVKSCYYKNNKNREP
jgi:hypothetical protein